MHELSIRNFPVTAVAAIAADTGIGQNSIQQVDLWCVEESASTGNLIINNGGGVTITIPAATFTVGVPLHLGVITVDAGDSLTLNKSVDDGVYKVYGTILSNPVGLAPST